MRKKYCKKNILEIGVEIIRKKGYHNTGINDILVACGIPKGSFYNFFDSKEDFGLQVIEYYGEQYQNIIQEYLNNKQYSPLNRLKNFYRFFIDMNQAEECQHGCLVNNLSQEIAGLYERFGKALDVQFQLIVSEVSTCIAAAQQSGEVRNDFSAVELAKFLHYSAFGAQTRMKSSRSIEPLEVFFRLSFDFLENKN